MKTFTCQDIALASYLKSKGMIIIELIRENNYYLFAFDKYEDCDKLANSYWNGIAEGNIKKFEEAKQTLISMIKNKR